MREKIVVLSGSGISAESGLGTFRDKEGFWEKYDIMEVASIKGWEKDFRKVLEFYNARRRDVAKSQPNEAHKGFADLEQNYEVQIITQNIDNLHEQAGSSCVLHLHGEITKVRSSGDDNYVIETGFKDLKEGMLCPKGYQLRPHIVWFGEPVPNMEIAIEYTIHADIFVVIGTSLEVYPAAGLLHYVRKGIPVYIIDPLQPVIPGKLKQQTHYIQDFATTGINKLFEMLQ